jgi:hypothetical protein
VEENEEDTMHLEMLTLTVGIVNAVGLGIGVACRKPLFAVSGLIGTAFSLVGLLA